MSIKMPVIKSIVSIMENKQFFKNYLFVCVQHILYTSIDLFDGLLALGANPTNIFLLGKIYSSNSKAHELLAKKHINIMKSSQPTCIGLFEKTFKCDIQRLWHEVEKKLKCKKIDCVVILDDGGTCISYIPDSIIKNYPVIGVEQTSSGLTIAQSTEFPLIEVASSAAKQHIESPMIAKLVEEKLEEIFLLNESKLHCSVIGLGAIGRSVTKKLIQLGHTVYIYDKNNDRNTAIYGSYKMNSIEETIFLSDYIFGCSGEDILKNIDIYNIIKKNKTFISCSSQDKEFFSLLMEYTRSNTKNMENIFDVLSDIKFCLVDNVYITILKGGFPINFDNSGYSVHFSDIQMTRGLLLCGLIQAAFINKNCDLKKIPKRIMLSPFIQRFVLEKLLPFCSSYVRDTLKTVNFRDIDWLIKNSGGENLYQFQVAELFNEISYQIQ